MEKMVQLFNDESGQTTVEWIVLSIMIAVAIVTIALTFIDAITSVIEKIKEKILDFIDAISF
ncbi:MAG: Flp family type IVb pilin [Candidatus Schekmanbacteria bacterium]|nr:Flp family type IVb pilin [Candidatus Schekmanbacteria bacterium]